MVKPKSQLKKPQKRRVDFKKIKRKIGRKFPPPKNATNTEVKSKAIVLPEQGRASDKAGLAVSKKGLTLKELLQQTSTIPKSEKSSGKTNSTFEEKYKIQSAYDRLKAYQWQ